VRLSLSRYLLYVQSGSDENILIASEIVGAVRGVDPKTGYTYDDTKRYIGETQNFTKEQRDEVFMRNAINVYPRLAAKI
jgi:4-oxalmesaconate hydratase